MGDNVRWGICLNGFVFSCETFGSAGGGHLGRGRLEEAVASTAMEKDELMITGRGPCEIRQIGTEIKELFMFKKRH
jgi:hypothetical protein